MKDYEMYGIDVSKYQNKNEIEKRLKTHGDFAIIKLGGSDGTYDEPYYKDSKFEQHYELLKNKTLVGGYYYSTATSTDRADREFSEIIRIMNGRKFTFPIFIDIEHPKQIELPLSTNEAIKHLLNKLWNANIFCGIYTTEEWYYKLHFNIYEMSKYPFWVAAWEFTPDILLEARGIHQYDCLDNVDINVCYTDYSSIIEIFKMNYTTPPEELYLKIAYEVIQGKWSAGEERKKMLEAAGYPYSIVQSIVNDLMRK